MNPIFFLKTFALKRVIEIADNAPEWANLYSIQTNRYEKTIPNCGCPDDSVEITQLKSLLESLNRVNQLGGVSTIQLMLEQMRINGLEDGMNISFDGEFIDCFNKKQLLKFIKDWESVYET